MDVDEGKLMRFWSYPLGEVRSKCQARPSRHATRRRHGAATSGCGVGPVLLNYISTFGEAFGHREARNGAHHERQIAGDKDQERRNDLKHGANTGRDIH